MFGESQPIFNGHDLAGWVHEGPRPTFSVHDGELRTDGSGDFANWLRTGREYEDFRLRFEYKLARWAEAAVYLRAPRGGRPANTGVAVILAHDFHHEVTEYVTGAVQGVLKPLRALPESYEEWRSVEIDLRGEALKVAIDGTVVQDTNLSGNPDLRHRLKKGYIGFPDRGHAYALRNIRVEDLGGAVRHVDLFDGRSLKGWQLRQRGNWTVRDGVLRASNGHGIHYAPGEFRDFVLTALVRSHNHVNAGVFLRGDAEGPRRGFEVQINSSPDAVYPTGSLYQIARSALQWDHEGEWVLLQVLAEGPRCVVWLNGEKVAETDRLKGDQLEAGRIGLQIHKDDASVEFRDIRVRPR